MSGHEHHGADVDCPACELEIAGIEADRGVSNLDMDRAAGDRYERELDARWS